MKLTDFKNRYGVEQMNKRRYADVRFHHLDKEYIHYCEFMIGYLQHKIDTLYERINYGEGAE